MPALITTTNNDARRTKLRGVGPAHVTSASALKARRASEQPPSEPDAPSPSPTVLKAVREFEHGRQRTKKAADTERRRERKERKRLGGAVVRPAHAGHARKAGGVDVGDAEGENEGCALGASRAELDEDGVGGADASVSQQISLEDLIKPAKLHRRKAEDFEVVPKVRSVIALDDPAPAIPEVDEPWEHVTLDDDHDFALSYAQVLATAA